MPRHPSRRSPIPFSFAYQVFIDPGQTASNPLQLPYRHPVSFNLIPTCLIAVPSKLKNGRRGKSQAPLAQWVPGAEHPLAARGVGDPIRPRDLPSPEEHAGPARAQEDPSARQVPRHHHYGIGCVRTSRPRRDRFHRAVPVRPLPQGHDARAATLERRPGRQGRRRDGGMDAVPVSAALHRGQFHVHHGPQLHPHKYASRAVEAVRGRTDKLAGQV